MHLIGQLWYYCMMYVFLACWSMLVILLSKVWVRTQRASVAYCELSCPSSWCIVLNESSERCAKMAKSLQLTVQLAYICIQRDQRGVAPADCWNWGEWGLKECNDNGPSLVWLVVPVQETFILPWLDFLHHRTQFQFMCPHRPATWAGSRAGPLVSECVSPVALPHSSKTWFSKSVWVSIL